MRAYSELGSVSYRDIRLWETNSFQAWTLIKIKGILSKAGFRGFYAFFLRPDCPRESVLSSTVLHCPLSLFQA